MQDSDWGAPGPPRNAGGPETKLTCGTCSQLKIKCDWNEGDPACRRCTRLGRDCQRREYARHPNGNRPASYTVSASSAPGSSSGVGKSRLQKAAQARGVAASSAAATFIATRRTSSNSPSSTGTPNNNIATPSPLPSPGIVSAGMAQDPFITAAASSGGAVNTDPNLAPITLPGWLYDGVVQSASSTSTTSGGSGATGAAWSAAATSVNPFFDLVAGAFPSEDYLAKLTSVGLDPNFGGGSLIMPMDISTPASAAATTSAAAIKAGTPNLPLGMLPGTLAALEASGISLGAGASPGNMASPIPHPMPLPNAIADLPDILLPSVAAYWNFLHASSTVVHRPIFERAFLENRTPIYGNGAPLALLYALAANGTRLTPMPGLTDEQRIRCARMYADRSKELVSAYYSQPEGQNAMTDIEALQTMLVLYDYFVPAGFAVAMFPFLERLADLAVNVCLDKATGGAVVGLAREPEDALEWVVAEMKTRAWLMTSLMDVATATIAKREPLHQYFRHKLYLPAHELFYDMNSWEDAFDLLFRAPDKPERTLVDFSVLSALEVDPDLRAQVLKDVISPTFRHAATYGTLGVVNNCMRDLRNRIRAFAMANGIAPLALISKDSSQDTPSERAYRMHVSHMDNLVADIYAAMPPEFGPDLAKGSGTSFFKLWPTYFSDRGYAHAFMASCVMVQAFTLENVMSGDPSTASAEIFSSPFFVRVLESAIIIVRLLRAQLEDDPGLSLLPYSIVYTVLRVGYLFLAAVRVSQNAGQNSAEMGYDDDVRVIARVLDSFGVRYPPLGTILAKDFAKAMTAAGVQPENETPDADGDSSGLPPAGFSSDRNMGGEDGQQVPVHRKFAETATASEKVLSSWIR